MARQRKATICGGCDRPSTDLLKIRGIRPLCPACRELDAQGKLLPRERRRLDAFYAGTLLMPNGQLSMTRSA